MPERPGHRDLFRQMARARAFEDALAALWREGLVSGEMHLQIIREHSRVVRFNNVRAAIILQFRNLDTFVHKDFVDRTDIYYIRRIHESRLSRDDYAVLVEKYS